MFARKLAPVLAGAWFAVALMAGPTLTTIQDVVYNADGTPYNGLAIIAWTPFQAGDTSKIGTQSVTINIVGGNLFVQLVPTTNATPSGYYTVTYVSAGKNQFTESWAVPPSTKPMQVRDVLMAPLASSSPLVSGGSPLTETNVTGLVADLAARPVEGANYLSGRAAVIDATGALEAASGNVSDCLHVDGSSGPCGTASGAAGPAFVDSEVPGGVVDGANTAFTLSQTPAPSSSLAIYRNGVLQKATQDYTVSSNAVRFQTPSTPQPGDTLLALYRVTPAGAPQGPPAPQVLCSGTGSATSSTTTTSLGTCTIPAGALQAGDRVRINFDYSHEGSLTGFTFTVNWGNTLLVQRNGGAADALITGWAEGGASPTACQLSVETWGTVLGLANGLLNGYDSFSYPIVLTFQARMAATTTDTVTLRNFTVVHVPKTP